jgi:hypothetical protein
MRRRLFPVLSCGLLIVAAACGSGQSIGQSRVTTSGVVPGTQVPPDVLLIPDIPIPPGTPVVREDTVIIGDDDAWTGQVVLQPSFSVAQMTEYFRVEMVKFGWVETAVVRARRTALTFSRGDRVAMVKVTPRGGSSSEADIVVAPNYAAPGPAGRSTGPRTTPAQPRRP